MAYDPEFIKKVMIGLKKSNYSIADTSRKYKVNRHTLMRWKKVYGEEIFGVINHSGKEFSDSVIKEQMVNEHHDVRVKIEDVVTLTLKRIMENLEGKPSISDISTKDLTILFKEVVQYILPKFEKDNKVGTINMETNYHNYIQNIWGKLNGKES